MNRIKPKTIQFNLRFRPEEFYKIRLFAEKLNYMSVAQLVRDAVSEFIASRRIRVKLKNDSDIQS